MVAGVLALGGMLAVQAPAMASAAPATAGTKVVLVDEAEADMVAQSCRYAGYFIYSDGRVVHVYVCEAA
ncbi:hypothetical protein C1701_24275 [Actinoalloteichus sp. AHMU CJ021]|nr:hypothetical protein C1701_24275 [Actinoalloteichus sp. AHMU CJ021]